MLQDNQFVPVEMGKWLSDVDSEGELDWLIKRMIPRGGVTLLSGQQKRSMKTWFSQQVAISLATGLQVGAAVDVGVPGRRTIIVMEEGSKFGYRDRFDACLYGHGLGRSIIKDKVYMLFRRQVKLDRRAHRDAILKMADQIKPDLIIFDTLYRMFAGDENKQEDANRMLDTLLSLGEQQFASLVLVHLDKTRGSNQKADIDDQVRGSGVITNGYDCHIALRRYAMDQKFIDLTVRPREGAEEWSRQVHWTIKSNKADKPVSAKMTIKERLGGNAKSKASNHAEGRPNGLPHLSRLQIPG